MTRRLSRPVTMLAAAVFLAAAVLAGSALAGSVFSGSARAATGTGASGAAAARMAAGGDVSLAGRMLETADLPAGFAPYPPLTGPLNAGRAKLLGGDTAQVAALLNGWVRDWYSARAGVEVREEAFDAGTSKTARGAMPSFDSSVLARGATEQRIAPDLDGFRSAFLISNVDYMAITVPLARGPYFFVLSVLAPAQSSPAAIGLETALVAVQSNRVPASTPDTGTSLSSFTLDTYTAAGVAVGLLVAYLCIVNGIAYLRSPLSRERRRKRSQVARRWPDEQRILDVSSGARRYRNTARLRLAVQFVGLSVAACGADPFLVTNWYVFLLAGAAIAWAGGRFIRPADQGSARRAAVLSGSRRVRVTLMRALASVLVVIGALFVIAYALNQAEPSGIVAASAATGSPLPSQGTADAFAWAGILLIAAGAVISRRARRLASVEARRVMLKDARPPVLYLRSFGDDALKLWTATLGRPSLIERFTPRRFDAFEEVIARHLALRGPVIALNPPGTRLAPLGAARETLESADWQSAIADWMERSSVIVFVAPPGRVTPGLTWELETVSGQGYWDKTLILVPPVPADLLHSRWQAFLHACARLWPFTCPLSLEGPGPLALTFRNSTWTVLTADRQNEWAYSAALREALGDLRKQPAVLRA